MKKKILFILHLPPPVHGAAIVGKHIKESNSINKTFDADFINLSTSGSMKEIGKGGLHKIFNFLKLGKQVYKALNSKPYDLCYLTLTASGVGFYKDILIVLMLKLNKKKIVYHFHNKGINTNSNNYINDKLYKFAFKNSKSILLSPRLYDDFKKYLKKEDVYFCFNGFPLPIKSNYSIRGVEICKILFLSNMVIEKGILTLLNSCKFLMEKNLDFECHFVGAWSNISEKEFRQLIEVYELSQHIYFHGPKYNEEKIDYFLTSDIFVLPSHSECFPLVLLEAMSYGLPIVSTNEGGIPNIVVDCETGFIIPPQDEDFLADKLEVLIKDASLRKEFGRRGRERYLNLFTIQKFEENLKKILDSAIAE